MKIYVIALVSVLAGCAGQHGNSPSGHALKVPATIERGDTALPDDLCRRSDAGVSCRNVRLVVEYTTGTTDVAELTSWQRTLIATARMYPETALHIRGATSGHEAVALADERAQKLRSVLVTAGVPESQIVMEKSQHASRFYPSAGGALLSAGGYVWLAGEAEKEIAEASGAQ